MSLCHTRHFSPECAFHHVVRVLLGEGFWRNASTRTGTSSAGKATEAFRAHASDGIVWAEVCAVLKTSSPSRSARHAASVWAVTPRRARRRALVWQRKATGAGRRRRAVDVGAAAQATGAGGGAGRWVPGR